MAAYEQSRVIRERLARDNPMVIQFQRDLAGSYNSIGILLRVTGEASEAAANYEQAQVIRERLARENPTVSEFQSDLGATLNNLASLDLDAMRFAEG